LNSLEELVITSFQFAAEERLGKKQSARGKECFDEICLKARLE